MTGFKNLISAKLTLGDSPRGGAAFRIHFPRV